MSLLMPCSICRRGEQGGPKRKDTNTFKALYGLEPELASKITHKQTVEVLNVHADAIPPNPESVTEKPHESFEKIIELLERFGDDEGYPDGLADVYQSFWHYHKHEVIEED
ncbi:hypothetical protein L873DRAFT_1789003 [Choiromyces venosus 120613-1]|uniref:Uncharacterized protein n=1 Tax=Choiromyces venosus 120613-1 TaxID=1336337 RepID=A0A3N4JT39_9PEZI|nr:hypothetical protein L873DRAFT_1789003 [Choiromyces venosus 120613-1]